MDRKDRMNIVQYLKEPYVKRAIYIAVVVILFVYLTQSFWMDFGIKSVYTEYNANETFFRNNSAIPDGVFILSGNYTYISEWINTTQAKCLPNSNVKLLVYSVKEYSWFKNIVVIKSINDCNK